MVVLDNVLVPCEDVARLSNRGCLSLLLFRPSFFSRASTSAHGASSNCFNQRAFMATPGNEGSTAGSLTLKTKKKGMKRGSETRMQLVGLAGRRTHLPPEWSWR